MGKEMYTDNTCHDTRACFAKKSKGNGEFKCNFLTSTYPDGKCPFCKPRMAYTNGRYYPHREYSNNSKNAG